MPFGNSVPAPYLEMTGYEVTVALGWVLLVFSVSALTVSAAEWFQSRVSERADPVRTPLIHERMISNDREDLLPSAPDVESPPQWIDTTDPGVQNNSGDVTELTTLTVFMDTANDSHLATIPFVVDELESDVRPQIPEAAFGRGNQPLGPGQRGSQSGGDARGNRREARWVLQHDEARTLHEYAQQLQSVGIQVAALDKTRGIVLLLNGIATESPVLQEVSDLSGERRMYLSWSEGSESLTQADRDLFLHAGFDASDSMIIHFLSPEAEEKLAALEAEAAAGQDVRFIRRTEFGIRPASEGFEFFVIRVLFR